MIGHAEFFEDSRQGRMLICSAHSRNLAGVEGMNDHGPRRSAGRMIGIQNSALAEGIQRSSRRRRPARPESRNKAAAPGAGITLRTSTETPSSVLGPSSMKKPAQNWSSPS